MGTLPGCFHASCLADVCDSSAVATVVHLHRLPLQFGHIVALDTFVIIQFALFVMFTYLALMRLMESW